MTTQDKKAWKKDEESRGCDRCGKEFTFFRRRHHCRRCGGIFCNDCCNEKVKGITGYGEQAQRICLKCKDETQAFITPDNTKKGRPKKRQFCILGQGSVGKTAIFQQFIDSSFPDTYTTTILNTKTKDVTLKGQDYTITVVDTAGQSSCDLFQPQFSIGTHAFILVYGVDDRSSFQSVCAIRDKILECGGHNTNMVLVGNKIDLPNNVKAVSSAEGKQLAVQWNVPFVEISAKKMKMVDNLFMETLQHLVNQENSNMS